MILLKRRRNQQQTFRKMERENMTIQQQNLIHLNVTFLREEKILHMTREKEKIERAEVEVERIGKREKMEIIGITIKTGREIQEGTKEDHEIVQGREIEEDRICRGAGRSEIKNKFQNDELFQSNIQIFLLHIHPISRDRMGESP
jgi:hypothetical protein